MQFKDVSGQVRIKEQLLSSAGRGRVPHAQLFLAPEGTGGLPLALAYAQYLNCQNPQPEDSCGVCDSCRKMTKLAHPDLHFSYPTVTRKAGEKPKATDFIKEWREAVLANPYLTYWTWMQAIDAGNRQGNITREECHDIIRKLSLKAFEGGYKVQIIWLAEYLDKSGNALLKILEEPPQNTVFLLVAENENLILNTILSRTQTLRIPPLQAKQVGEYLRDKQEVPEEEAMQVAALADGSISFAQSLAASTDNDYIEEMVLWLRLSYSVRSNALELLQWIDRMAPRGREYQKNFLKYGLHLFRSSLLANHGLTQLQHVTPAEEDFLSRFAKMINDENAAALVEAFTETAYHIERNAHPKTSFFQLSLRIYELLRQSAKAA